MKRFISSILITGIFLISLLSGITTVYADDSITMTVEDGSGIPGEEIQINIGLENMPENYVSGAELRLQYDDSVLEAVSVDELSGVLKDGGQGNNPTINTNPYYLSYGSGIGGAINTATSGTLLTIS